MPPPMAVAAGTARAATATGAPIALLPAIVVPEMVSELPKTLCNSAACCHCRRRRRYRPVHHLRRRPLR